MTTDAINQAQVYVSAIASLNAEKVNALAKLAKLMPSLSSDQVAALNTTITNNYAALITAQQTLLTNLDGNYTKS